MAVNSRIDPARFVGRSPERLSLEEMQALAGKWVALEIYSPETLPMRRIEAIGDSAEECIRQLSQRGLDPKKFEFTPLKLPY